MAVRRQTGCWRRNRELYIQITSNRREPLDLIWATKILLKSQPQEHPSSNNAMPLDLFKQCYSLVTRYSNLSGDRGTGGAFSFKPAHSIKTSRGSDLKKNLPLASVLKTNQPWREPQFTFSTHHTKVKVRGKSSLACMSCVQ